MRRRLNRPWTALAEGKERDWWSIDLEGEVEKLQVSGPWFGTEGDSVEPKGRWATGQIAQRWQERKRNS